MFVEGSGEVNVQQMLMIQSQPQSLSGKAKVVQVVRVNGRVTVGLEGAACKNKTKPYTENQLMAELLLGWKVQPVKRETNHTQRTSSLIQFIYTEGKYTNTRKIK